MGADDKLYELLAGDREIPWGYAAGEFLRVKVASGGLYPDDAQEVCKVIVAAAQITEEQKEKAVQQGLLSGMRGLVAGDIGLIGRGERTRGSRLGKSIGTLAGAGAGLLTTRGGTRGGRALGVALGGLGGRTIGEAVGSEIDVAKAKARLHGAKQKKAEIEKQAEEKKMKPALRAALFGAPIGAASGLAVGLVAPKLHARSVLKRIARIKKQARKGISELQFAELLAHAGMGKRYANALFRKRFGGKAPLAIGTTGLGAATGAIGGAGAVRIKEYIKDRRAGIEKVRIGPKEREALVAKHGPGVLRDLGIDKKAAVKRVLDLLTKMAQNPGSDPTITSPTVPLPAESPLVNPTPAELHPAIQGQLDQLQQQNESEFYRMKAEQAQQEADANRQRVEELIQQINMLNQQSQMQMQQDQQVRQMAEQNAQAAQQDSMMARNESMAAQQQNLALREAVTQFRQALMNLVTQDPTQIVGPPPVLTGPLPEAEAASAPAFPAAPPGGAAPQPLPEVSAPVVPAPEPMAPPPPSAPTGGAAPAPMAR